MSIKKIYIIIAILFISLIILICGLTYYFIFTTKGSASVAKLALFEYSNARNIEIEKEEGSLSEKVSYHNIEISDFKDLPPGTVLKVQRLDVYFTSLNLEGLNVEIFNGRLKLPGLNQILFYGNYKDAFLNFSVYSKDVDIRYLMDLFSGGKGLEKLSGKINEADLYIKGRLLEPEIEGELQIDRFLYDKVSIENCPIRPSLKLTDIKDALKIFGEVVLNSGTISGPKTAIINLHKSKIAFSGDPKKPHIDLQGDSTVERINIAISLKGPIDKPDLKLTSEPPLPSTRLLVMLATGRSWKGADESLNEGRISADLVKDFVDYFFFAGSGSKLAERFGIDLSVTYNSETKGVSVKKTISEKAEATYRAEQPQAKEKEEKQATNQYLGGEYKITDAVSIGAEKELPRDTKDIETQKTSQPNDKVFLKYKQKF
jgi:hypothetical protein